MTDSTAGPSLDRRRFMQMLSAAGLGFGLPPMLASCGGSGGASRETRQYFFNLPQGQQNELVLVAGEGRTPLQRATPANLQAIRSDIPSLPDDGLTHVAEVDLPGDSPQLCYVQEVHGPGPTDWSMLTMFHHVPMAGVEQAKPMLTTSCKAEGDLLRQGFTACPTASVGELRALAAAASFCVGPQYDRYKDAFDNAISLISNHPEVGSFDTVTLSYVQSEIICRDSLVFELAASIHRQGKATTQGGWATLVPAMDPDTGKMMLDSNGKAVCTVKYSDETLRRTGVAIASVLRRVKDDVKLGANVTNLSSMEAAEQLRGKSWFVEDGTPNASTPPPRFASSPVGAAVAVQFTKRDTSGGAGFALGNFSPVGGRKVRFIVRNNYLRWLGLYVRFLDGKMEPISLGSLPSGISGPSVPKLNGANDLFLRLVQPQFSVLGIPLQPALDAAGSSQHLDNVEVEINVPEQASAFRILAGGLGRGSDPYPQTTDPGAIMTIVLNMALPGLFLVWGVATGYAVLCQTLANAVDVLLEFIELFIKLLIDVGLYGAYQDSSVFTNLIPQVTVAVFKTAKFAAAVNSSVGVGHATNMVPFGAGLILQAIMALALAGQIARTSAEVAQSPKTYVTEVVLSHDVTVTIHHDPKHATGFPNTAAFYELTAVCDDSSPRSSGRIAMQQTTRTQPITYVFRGLPSGGRVNISVTFTTARGTLVGAGQTGSVDNLLDAQQITIEEKLVDINAQTRYLHKQKTIFNGVNSRAWVATGTPPAANPLDCSERPAALCELVGITISDATGSVAYGWRGNDAPRRTLNGAGPNGLYHLSALSLTDTPQAGYSTLGFGTPTPARVAYDRYNTSSGGYYLDTTTGRTLVRRIRTPGVNQPAVFDGPQTRMSVGYFNFDSDAFLLHPEGKLISFNAAESKMEVLEPSPVPVGDASAPQALSLSGPGRREGLLLGPVAATVMHDGNILVLEQELHRVQAFDTGARPSRTFGERTWFDLRTPTETVTYLDITAEATGLIYVLLRLDASNTHLLDIYARDGSFITRTSGVNAGKMAVSLFRDVYTLNYDNIFFNHPSPLSVGRVEPSISLWIPNA